jgi:hypothetical protein
MEKDKDKHARGMVKVEAGALVLAQDSPCYLGPNAIISLALSVNRLNIVTSSGNQAIPESSTLLLGTLAGLGLAALSLRRCCVQEDD